MRHLECGPSNGYLDRRQAIDGHYSRFCPEMSQRFEQDLPPSFYGESLQMTPFFQAEMQRQARVTMQLQLMMLWSMFEMMRHQAAMMTMMQSRPSFPAGQMNGIPPYFQPSRPADRAGYPGPRAPQNPWARETPNWHSFNNGNSFAQDRNFQFQPQGGKLFQVQQAVRFGPAPSTVVQSTDASNRKDSIQSAEIVSDGTHHVNQSSNANTSVQSAAVVRPNLLPTAATGVVVQESKGKEAEQKVAIVGGPAGQVTQISQSQKTVQSVQVVDPTPAADNRANVVDQTAGPGQKLQVAQIASNSDTSIEQKALGKGTSAQIAAVEGDGRVDIKQTSTAKNSTQVVSTNGNGTQSIQLQSSGNSTQQVATSGEGPRFVEMRSGSGRDALAYSGGQGTDYVVIDGGRGGDVLNYKANGANGIVRMKGGGRRFWQDDVANINIGQQNVVVKDKDGKILVHQRDKQAKAVVVVVEDCNKINLVNDQGKVVHRVR